MKVQYNVTVNGDISKEAQEQLFRQLAVEFNWIVQDISEMLGQNITLQWEEIE